MFGQNYSFDKEHNIIARSLTSVKYMNSNIPNELAELSKHNPKTFVELLSLLESSSVDTRQLDILIRTRFFREFGNTSELTKITEWFRFLKNGFAKQISAEALDNAPDWFKSAVQANATNIGKDGKQLKRWSITDCMAILNIVEQEVKRRGIKERPVNELVKDSIEFLGYIDITTGKPEDRLKTVVTDVIPMKSKDGSIWARNIISVSLGTGRSAACSVNEKLFASQPIKVGDIIKIENVYKNKRGYWYIGAYKKITE